MDPLVNSYSSGRQGAYDLNNLTESGTYFCTNGSTNKPASVGGGLLVIKGLTNSIQFMIDYNEKVWIRNYQEVSGIWSTWKALN